MTGCRQPASFGLSRARARPIPSAISLEVFSRPERLVDAPCPRSWRTGIHQMNSLPIDRRRRGPRSCGRCALQFRRKPTWRRFACLRYLGFPRVHCPGHASLSRPPGLHVSDFMGRYGFRSASAYFHKLPLQIGRRHPIAHIELAVKPVMPRDQCNLIRGQRHPCRSSRHATSALSGRRPEPPDSGILAHRGNGFNRHVFGCSPDRVWDMGHVGGRNEAALLARYRLGFRIRGAMGQGRAAARCVACFENAWARHRTCGQYKAKTRRRGVGHSVAG